MISKNEKLTYGRVTHGFTTLTHFLSNAEIKIAMADCTVLGSAGPREGLPLVVTTSD